MDIITKYVDFSLTTLDNYTRLIMEKYFNKDIFLEYKNTYRDIRFYNQETNLNKRLEPTLNEALTNIYNKNKNDILEIMLEIIKIYYYLDDVKALNNISLNDIVKKISILREKLNLETEEFNKSFRKVLNNDRKRKMKYLTNLNCNDFYITQKKIKGISLYKVTLNDNVEIPKLYSSYAINEVKTNSKVTLELLKLEYTLVSSILLKNIIKGNFNKKYLVNFNSKIFEKDKEYNELIKIIDNDISRDNIIMIITPTNYKAYKEEFFTLRKKGFNFALYINNYEEYHLIKQDNLDFFYYILINKELENKVKINKSYYIS